jgi:hypothetical protein
MGCLAHITTKKRIESESTYVLHRGIFEQRGKKYLKCDILTDIITELKLAT